MSTFRSMFKHLRCSVFSNCFKFQNCFQICYYSQNWFSSEISVLLPKQDATLSKIYILLGSTFSRNSNVSEFLIELQMPSITKFSLFTIRVSFFLDLVQLRFDKQISHLCFVIYMLLCCYINYSCSAFSVGLQEAGLKD